MIKPKRTGARITTGAISKELVNSWDLFDTLLTRFYLDPAATFRIVDAKHQEQQFYQRRIRAQLSLDKTGTPYVLHDIYKQMVKEGLSEQHAMVLLVEELKVEHHLMFPVRAVVELVSAEDIIVSDMYMSEQNIAELVWKICGLRMLRPVVRSNWGKATGTIWPELLRHYVIRKHAGDNQRSDIEIPRKYGIETVLVTETHMTAWEKKVSDLGEHHLSLILRETRLRSITANSSPVYNVIVGPYLTLLYCFSLWIYTSFGNNNTRFVFLRRDCEDLSRIFSTLFPFSDVKQIDLTRSMAYANNPGYNNVLASQINSDSLLIDMVSTGRSAFRFIDQAGAVITKFVALMYLDTLLKKDEVPARNLDVSSGRFHFFTQTSDVGKHHYPLECLTQTECPPVVSLGYDARSGGVIRSYGKSDLSSDEKKIIGGKSNLLQEFMNSIHRRGFVPSDVPTAELLIQHSLHEILSAKEILRHFPSFIAREKNG